MIWFQILFKHPKMINASGPLMSNGLQENCVCEYYWLYDCYGISCRMFQLLMLFKLELLYSFCA